jgi:hypothetical protein
MLGDRNKHVQSGGPKNRQMKLDEMLGGVSYDNPRWRDFKKKKPDGEEQLKILPAEPPTDEVAKTEETK